MNETEVMPAVAARPPPLIQSDVDLRDFRFMPLDVVQLQNSATWAMADGWASKALVNLWTKAWHQVPAGSLPDNDDLHRTWANVPSWESVRDVALRGFIKCIDGRLYHRVICQKALDAWNERKRFRRAAKARWNTRKQRMRRICTAHPPPMRRMVNGSMQRICKGQGQGQRDVHGHRFIDVMG